MGEGDRPNYILPSRIALYIKTDSFKVKEWKKIYYAGIKQKEAEVAVLISKCIILRPHCD